MRFHEKPHEKTAKFYFTLDTMLWNIGIFCGKASVFINEYKKNASHLYQAVFGHFKNKGSYADCENISIDHAVLEKSSALYVLPSNFAWSDVGNLEIFLELLAKHKQASSKTVEINSENNIVEAPKKLVALIGVENLCIIETDDVLLIAQRDQTDNVKRVIKKLRIQKDEQYL